MESFKTKHREASKAASMLALFSTYLRMCNKCFSAPSARIPSHLYRKHYCALWYYNRRHSVLCLLIELSTALFVENPMNWTTDSLLRQYNLSSRMHMHSVGVAHNYFNRALALCPISYPGLPSIKFLATPLWGYQKKLEQTTLSWNISPQQWRWQHRTYMYKRP